MSIFHFIDNKRESNTTVGRMELLEHWKNPVILLMKDNNPMINGVVEIYLTKESVNKRVDPIADKSSYSYCQTTCIQAVNAALTGDCVGMSINGLAQKELYVTQSDLMEIKEPVDGIIMMMAIISEAVERKTAFQNMADMNFYMLGELPSVSEEGKPVEDFDTMKSKKRDGQAVKLFILEDHAKEVNTRNFPIMKYRFADIAAYMKGKYAIVIEAYEDYKVEFSKDEVNQFVNRG